MDLNIKSFGMNAIGGDLADSANYLSEIFKELVKEQVIGVVRDSTIEAVT